MSIASLVLKCAADVTIQHKLAPYGTDGRLFTTDVSANFKVM